MISHEVMTLWLEIIHVLLNLKKQVHVIALDKCSCTAMLLCLCTTAGATPRRCVPAEAGGVYGVVRLSPPAQPARLLSQPACTDPGLRSGLRWLKGSGDDTVGCG